MRLIVFIVLMLTIAGCSRPDPDRFYSDEYGFSIKLPEDWAVQKGYMDSVVRAENQEYSQGKIFQETVNIVADSLPPDMSIDEYHTSAKDLMKKTLPELIEVNSGTDIVDNREVFWFAYRYPLKPVMLKVVVYSIHGDNKIFLITCMAEEERFKDVKPVFIESVRSFEFQ